MSRSVRAALAAALAVASFGASTAAQEPGFEAALTCRPEAAPGRVLCELALSARAGQRLSWADALVTAAPQFARPLRSRVAVERFASGGGNERKLNLAFVASGPGVGQVSVKARAVVCRGAADRSTCRPESRELSAEIRVGS